MKHQATNPEQRQPWGLISGLLTGCAVTLVGAIMNLQPETILVRSFLGGCLVGGCMSLLASGWRTCSPAEEDA